MLDDMCACTHRTNIVKCASNDSVHYCMTTYLTNNPMWKEYDEEETQFDLYTL